MRRMAVVLAGLAAVLGVTACAGGGSDQRPVPEIAEVRSERVVADGAATLSSTVTVIFDRAFEVAPGQVPLASYFEFDVPDYRGGTRRQLVAKAERGESNARLVTLTVERLVPDGATLRVQRRAFNRDGKGELTAEVAGDLPEALALLASTALRVTNPAVIPDGDVAPLKPEDRDSAAQRAALEAHLKLRGAGEETTGLALERYDTMSAEIVTSPKLRAALAGLTGTFAEAAIDSYLTPANCTRNPASLIAFREPPDAPQLIARVTFANRRRVVSVNPFAEGERLELLMPVLAHEAIHCDNEGSLSEELAATAFDSFLYLQLLSWDPALATLETKVSRELNVDAVAMINSGRRLPESVGILPSVGVTKVLPDTSSPAGSFAELVAGAYSEIEVVNSPAEQLAITYAAALAVEAGLAPDNPFNLRYLDELLGRAISGETLLNAITALSMQP